MNIDVLTHRFLRSKSLATIIASVTFIILGQVVVLHMDPQPVLRRLNFIAKFTRKSFMPAAHMTFQSIRMSGHHAANFTRRRLVTVSILLVAGEQFKNLPANVTHLFSIQICLGMHFLSVISHFEFPVEDLAAVSAYVRHRAIMRLLDVFFIVRVRFQLEVADGALIVVKCTSHVLVLFLSLFILERLAALNAF